MTTRDDKPKGSGRRWVLTGAAIVLTAAVLAVTLVTLYLVLIGPPLRISAEWGQLGDFVGGTINPIVGLATVCLVFVALLVQREELSATVKAMRQANVAARITAETTHTAAFEQSLFSWLESYHSLVNCFEHGGANGRRGLMSFYDAEFSADALSRRSMNIALFAPDSDPHNLCDAIDQVSRHYDEEYAKNRAALSPIFRTLYRLIGWIHTSETLDFPSKRHYVALVRAQLSTAELSLMLLNGLTPRGLKFVAYSNRYAMFDTLIDDADPFMRSIAGSGVRRHIVNEMLSVARWGYASSAFSSDIARETYRVAEEELDAARTKRQAAPTSWQ